MEAMLDGSGSDDIFATTVNADDGMVVVYYLLKGFC
jgi:hypothetical protein